MFVLQLNPMRSRAEDVRPVAYAETREALINFIEAEKVEPYKDDGSGGYGNEHLSSGYSYHKTFRKMGPLEWFNPPPDTENYEPGYRGEGIVRVPTREEHLEQASAEYDNYFAAILKVDD